MHILYIVKYIAQLGGLDRILSYKMNYFANQPGNEVYLITYEQGSHPFSFPLSDKITHTDVNVRFFTRHKYGLTKRLMMYFKMRRTFQERINKRIEEICPDIIVTFTDSYILLDILMQIPRKYKVVVESHVERKSTVKKADFKHNRLLHAMASIYDNYILKKLKRCDAFVTLTSHDAEEWKGLKNIQIIPNPLPCIPARHSTLQNKRIISVGRLEPQKGYDLLINAWAIVSGKHPDWHLDIYGDGGVREKLQAQVEELHLQQTCAINPATTEIYSHYIDSSIYVMSSRYEGFGLVLIEAMSCGLPCISFDCPYGPADIINNGEDGILVDPGNIVKMAEAICFLIENESVRQDYGQKALRNVQRYCPENIMPQWERLFSSLAR